MTMDRFPRAIDTGAYRAGHIQGIALDAERGILYCSYTQILVKLDLQGNLLGSVTGLTGHLGCIEFNPDDGKVYGSLEYKNDSIGKGIRKFLGCEEKEAETSFYIAIFDVDKIDRVDMDACADGVMKTVYLREVVDDYNAAGENGREHRYACSGIDGTSFGPRFGQTDGKRYLTVAYGIYGDVTRADNDRQVLLQYDISGWDSLAQPLNQDHFHKSGPAACDGKYFLHTGNTDWGVQNLQYDAGESRWLLFVYRGKKENYPNYPLYSVKADAPVFINEAGETCLTLERGGAYHEESGIGGWLFPRGAEGVVSFGNGYFYVSHPFRTEDGRSSSVVRLCQRTDGAEFMKVLE